MGGVFAQEPLMIVARLLGLLVAIPVHEVAHAFVSDKLGDPTARNMGRLTLNPLKHIDPFGLLSMLIIGVGWAKPVPVDPRYYKNHKAGMALTAVAGPVSNLVLALVSTFLYKVAFYGGYAWVISAGATALPGWLEAVVVVLQYFALLNVSLALFNLLPIPPLDGSRILALVLPDRVNYALQRIERYMLFVLLAVLVVLPRLTGFSPLNWLLGDVAGAVYSALDWLTGFVDMLFWRLLPG